MENNLCIIGVGHMGRSIAEIILSTQLWDKERIIICDQDQNRLQHFVTWPSLKLCVDSCEAVKSARIIILAVKPQDAIPLFEHIRPAVAPQSLLISVMAGVSIKSICKLTGCDQVIRTMPNLPVMLGKGMIGWSCSTAVDNTTRLLFKKTIRQVGKEIYFDDEATLDKITALSGSGPMYIAFLAHSIMDAGQKLGLPEAEAQTIAVQTLLGSSMLLDQLSLSPAHLITQITSKGGTTEQAMKIFVKHKLNNIISEAIEAAYERAQKLSDTFK